MIIVITIKKKYLIILPLIIIGFIFFIQKYDHSITTFYLPINNKVIVIDPGHGGIDPGAVGKLDKTEDEINLDIALRLKRLLEHNGGIVIMTREEDVGLYTEKSKTVREKRMRI